MLCWRNLIARGHLEDLDLDGRIILKWFFNTWAGGLDWNEWRAVVNKLMNI
jgi:hypothetical protein